MKLKSFLVACVGGVITITGASTGARADKPVEYVKICSLYGAGFYYIPGTDMCIKVGGYVRAQTEYNSINGLSFGSTNGVNTPGTTNGGAYGPSTIDNGAFNRFTDSYNFGFRGVISADARNQTEYGTVRSYIRLGLGTNSNNSNAANQFFVDRAFVQFAGFTAGLTQSSFDIFSNTELFSYTNAKTSGDTYNYGIAQFGYTAQFGNGFSGSIAAEIPRYQGAVSNGFSSAWATNGVVTQDQAGQNVPDIVGNLRVDQSWGYVGVSGALHQVAAKYYDNPTTLERSGHPDDKWGWAAQIGGLFYLPGGDKFGASFVTSKGATGYATKAGSWQMYHGNSVGVGWLVDGLYDGSATAGGAGGGGNQIHLTNAWSLNAGYEHMWNQRWRTSLYGGYTKIWYDGDTKNIINSHLPGSAGTTPCNIGVFNSTWPPVNITVGSNNSCDPGFSFWQVGSRTQWNPSPGLDIGLDVTYTRLNTAYKGVGTYPQTTNHAATTGGIDDQGTWSAVFRVQRAFYP